MSSTPSQRRWWILLARCLFVIFAIVEQASSPWHVFQRDSCVDMDWLSHLRMPPPADGAVYASSPDDEVPLLGTASTNVGRPSLSQPDHGSYEIALSPLPPSPPERSGVLAGSPMRHGFGAPRGPPGTYRSLPPRSHAPPLHA